MKKSIALALFLGVLSIGCNGDRNASAATENRKDAPQIVAKNAPQDPQDEKCFTDSCARQEEKEKSHVCGAKTKTGGSCKRRVKGEGFCWMHKDQEKKGEKKS